MTKAQKQQALAAAKALEAASEPRILDCYHLSAGMEANFGFTPDKTAHGRFDRRTRDEAITCTEQDSYKYAHFFDANRKADLAILAEALGMAAADIEAPWRAYKTAGMSAKTKRMSELAARIIIWKAGTPYLLNGTQQAFSTDCCFALPTTASMTREAAKAELKGLLATSPKKAAKAALQAP